MGEKVKENKKDDERKGKYLQRLERRELINGEKYNFYISQKISFQKKQGLWVESRENMMMMLMETLVYSGVKRR